MHGQPEAGRDMGQGLLFAERQHDPGNRFTYPFNHLMGARQIGIGEQDQEFLTAPTAARVVFADIGSNDLGNPLCQLALRYVPVTQHLRTLVRQRLGIFH